MSDTKQVDNGGPAFPQGTLDAKDGYKMLTVAAQCGLSVRDYFAAKAIFPAAMFWTGADQAQRKLWSGCKDNAIIEQRDMPNFIANVSLWIADAMLRARDDATTDSDLAAAQRAAGDSTR